MAGAFRILRAGPVRDSVRLRAAGNPTARGSAVQHTEALGVGREDAHHLRGWVLAELDAVAVVAVLEEGGGAQDEPSLDARGLLKMLLDRHLQESGGGPVQSVYVAADG